MIGGKAVKVGAAIRGAGSDSSAPFTPRAGMRLVPMGSRLAAMPGLNAFLPEAIIAPLPFGLLGADALLGWGRKGSGAWAQRLGPWLNKPVVTLEDGFVRSLGLGVAGAEALSVVVDDLGVHYDSTRPSRIEAMLEQGGWESDALLVRARAAMAAMRMHRISKYNVAAGPSPRAAAILAGEPFVLVVDQTSGDAALACAAPDAFSRMLAAARAETPGARVIVKTHPDVVAGHRRGLIAPEAVAAVGATLLGEALDPWTLMERMTRLYTVTSQMGLEALVAGKPVRCFGLPFYAGWGATEDEVACARRTRRRSVEEIVAAAYLVYARYADPRTGQPRTLEETIAAIVAARAARV